jgi:hypothetical protein
MGPAETPQQPRELNKLALWSLFATCVLLFPVGLVLGALALVRIKKTGEGGAPLAIIAIVAGLLAPAVVLAAVYGRPMKFDACYQTQQLDGVPVLRLIRFLEEKYKEEHGRYGSLEEIGFEPQVPLKNYEFSVDHYDETSFRAVARGKRAMDGDLMLVDEGQQVHHTRDLCKLERPETGAGG